MSKMSRNKGKRGEREFAGQWNLLMPGTLKRGVQYSGGEDSPDVCGVSGLHFEVKRVERLMLDAAYKQAVDDCGENVPIVAHRKNRGNWMLTFALEDLQELVNCIQQAQREEDCG